MASTHYLQPLFAPTSLALVGASSKPGSLGRIVFENLLNGRFNGDLFAVNPHHRQVLERESFASIKAIGAKVDLAVICAPPASVAAILAAARGRVRAALILSGAPTTNAADYQHWWRAIGEQSRATGIRVLGPASFGVMRTSIGLNATYGSVTAAPGRLTLISQSGAVCSALLDFARSAAIGFESVLGLGAAADLDFGELLDYAITDPETDGIVLYIETLRNARAFLSALRAAARTKPVIVLKAGRYASSAVRSERDGATENDLDADVAFDAALKRAGTVRVRTYAQLFAAARMLASGRIPAGNRLTIVTNGRGPGLLAADHAVDAGVTLASLSASTKTALQALLPPDPSVTNPVDVRGEATPDRFASAVRLTLADANTDAVLALHVAVPAASAVETAIAVASVSQAQTKPVLAAWLGIVDQPQARVALEAAGVANFLTPENAVDAFSFLAAYRRNQQWLLEAPPPQPELSAPDLAAAERIGVHAPATNDNGVAELDAVAAASLLVAFGVPTARVARVTTLDDALCAARQIGFPVALDDDETPLAPLPLLRDGRMLRRAWNERTRDQGSALASKRKVGARTAAVVIRQQIDGISAHHARISLRTDAVFGPLIGYGASGAAAARMTWTLPPLNRRLAVELIAAARAAGMNARAESLAAPKPADPQSAAVDIQAQVAALLQVSALACALPWVVSVDIDPLVVTAVAAIASRVRMAVDPGRKVLAPGYRHMAIHPYPIELESSLTLRTGATLRLRPIRPEDARLEMAFVNTMSEESRYRRFMQHLSALTPQMLARFTQVDYDRELALVVLTGSSPRENADSDEKIVAVARYVANPDQESAEFAIAVADAWHGRGLGGALMRRLIECARKRGFKRLVGVILASNAPMQKLADRLGFTLTPDPDDAEQTIATLDLKPPGGRRRKS